MGSYHCRDGCSEGGYKRLYLFTQLLYSRIYIDFSAKNIAEVKLGDGSV